MLLYESETPVMLKSNNSIKSLKHSEKEILDKMAPEKVTTILEIMGAGMIQKKIYVLSTYFFRCNFDGRKIQGRFHVLFRQNFAGWNIHVFSTYFFRCNFDERKIHVVSLTFFDVILMVEKSTFFACTFFRQNFDGQKFDVTFGLVAS